MIMNELDDRIKRHYKAQKMNSWVAEDIINSSVDNPETAAKMPSRPWSEWSRLSLFRLSPLPIAAVFMLAMVGASLATHHYGSQAERMTRMLREAAMNHSTRLQLEFKSSNVVSINNSMQQLPFNVTLPDEFKHGYEVLGARYCTISGHLAAHLKLIDKSSNKQISLFMTRASDDLSRVSRAQKGVDGIDVQLWTESGLFYAKAQLGS